MTTLAILTAAGSGARLGRHLPKALVELGGVPLVLHAARRLAASRVVDALVVTAPDGSGDVVARTLADPAVTVPVTVVDGGPTRQASVAAGLAAAGTGHDVVIVHDAARPLVPPDLVQRVVAAVRAGHDAVVPGLPVTDTVKQVAPGGDAELVLSTPDRAGLRAVQTPQGFTRDLLERAHKAGQDRSGSEADAATDDAGLVEALGEPVHMVRGDAAAAKITTERDLRIAALELED
ncbi:2-C-methyl-D-erythritol 4-phosphate cytidylyltransferase [Myceligenerans salitolerans]|uniref:2-C-methyl-D-erythritol 4-phosphate cytidylyltransferase n=1 Tax=Myceligenerans salitolerans TaxID=1230528 RepID=A0ABS3ID99_9MICO|nr:2-C-methyl-D-erythritol 4-phosphate cytidylyltransferase [Myceligenerans salitolerans]MBO0610965.1 2-C-methyl-D-erythritol 4-phosphate cytidylyltransferase [Myceligenerans salitolerans]